MQSLRQTQREFADEMLSQERTFNDASISLVHAQSNYLRERTEERKRRFALLQDTQSITSTWAKRPREFLTPGHRHIMDLVDYFTAKEIVSVIPDMEAFVNVLPHEVQVRRPVPSFSSPHCVLRSESAIDRTQDTSSDSTQRESDDTLALREDSLESFFLSDREPH